MPPPGELSLSQRKTLKAKVCLVGEKAVGKTSLIRRFVLNTFDDRYITTIGTKVSKKEITVWKPESGLEWSVDMTVWDIMGEKGFRELLKDAYFFGAQGALAVADVTRQRTLEDLDDWVDGVFRVVGKIPVMIAVNKVDLLTEAQFPRAKVEQVADGFGAKFFYTSAKTGHNVEKAFQALADVICTNHLAARK